MPHVQLATGVREHRQAIIFGLIARVFRGKAFLRLPLLLRLLFDFFERILLLHGILVRWNKTKLYLEATWFVRCALERYKRKKAFVRPFMKTVAITQVI
jgi:hypothetical protein